MSKKILTKSENADYHVSLKVLIKDKKGKILILRAAETSQLKGFFDLPGGRIKETERHHKLLSLINRELTEELGSNVKVKIKEIPVAVGRHEYWSKKFNKQQYLFWVLFEAKYIGGNVIISSEHSNFLWVKITKNNLKKYFIKGPLETMTHYFTRKLQ